MYVLLLAVTGGCAILWLLYGSKTSNPHNYATVGDIPVPWGYERIAGDDAAYRKNGGFKVFRAKTGWHWKHVWTSPVDWYSWIESFVRGYYKIRF